MNRLWSAIKSIISNKGCASSSITKIKNNGVESSDPTEIPNVLNNYLVKTAENLSNTVPKTPKSPLDYLIQKIPRQCLFTQSLKQKLRIQLVLIQKNLLVLTVFQLAY